MGRSIGPMSEKTKTGSGPAPAPRLNVPMSLQPAIPRRVALQQSSPPLYQLGAILNKKAQFEKQKPWNGKCASSKLSQLRGSPHKSACATACTVFAIAPEPVAYPRPKKPHSQPLAGARDKEWLCNSTFSAASEAHNARNAHANCESW